MKRDSGTRARLIAVSLSILIVTLAPCAMAQVSTPEASTGRRFPRTDVALGLLGDLELGGMGGSGGYLTLNVGGRLDVVPTLPFVGQIAYTRNVGETSGPGYTVSVGTGFKFADMLGSENLWVVTGAGEINRYWNYVEFTSIAGLARRYQVLRGGFFSYTLERTDSTTSNGFYVGYSRNTLVQANAPAGTGMPGLRAINSLALDLLVGSVPPVGARKSNKLGFRGSWTQDLGNIGSVRWEAGLRPALGYYGVLAIEVFFLSSVPWF
jgi:hypothetical protein